MKTRNQIILIAAVTTFSITIVTIIIPAILHRQPGSFGNNFVQLYNGF